MKIERDLLISLLKLTKDGPVTVEHVKSDAKTTLSIATKLLEKLQKEDTIYLEQGTIEASTCNRLKLAVKAVCAGADFQHVSDMLRWQEFEEIAAVAMEKNGYAVAKNVHFGHVGRKWEMDIIGCRKPIVVCIDCKHWRRGTSPSTLKRIAETQVERTRALAESLPSIALKLECTKWDKAKIVPAILTLMPVSFKFCDKVPIIPALQLQDFLSHLPVYAESLNYFLRRFNHLRHDF